MEYCKLYQVEKYDGAEWQPIKTIAANLAWTYDYRSIPLLDQTLHRFRIVALGDVFRESLPLEFRTFNVCPPTLVESGIEIDYNETTHAITVTEV